MVVTALIDDKNKGLTSSSSLLLESDDVCMLVADESTVLLPKDDSEKQEGSNDKGDCQLKMKGDSSSNISVSKCFWFRPTKNVAAIIFVVFVLLCGTFLLFHTKQFREMVIATDESSSIFAYDREFHRNAWNMHKMMKFNNEIDKIMTQDQTTMDLLQEEEEEESMIAMVDDDSYTPFMCEELTKFCKMQSKTIDDTPVSQQNKEINEKEGSKGQVVSSKEKITSYVRLPPKTYSGCPKGYGLSQSECLEFGMQESGGGSHNPVTGGWSHTPCGCFVNHEFNSLQFNTGPACGTDVRCELVCKAVRT